VSGSRFASVCVSNCYKKFRLSARVAQWDAR
jgi:hypothetical protein